MDIKLKKLQPFTLKTVALRLIWKIIFFGKNRNFLHKGLRNKSKGRKPCVKKGLWGISCMKYTLTLFRHPWWITYILNTAINEINRCLHLAESFTYDETQPSLQVTVENGITLTKTKKKSKKQLMNLLSQLQFSQNNLNTKNLTY